MNILETVDETGCKKTLTIEVVAEDLDKEVKALYEDINSKAMVPGFRPGHVPIRLLEMRFGRAVLEDARGKAMENACKKILEDLNINPVGDPVVEPLKEEKAEGEKGEEKKEPGNQPFKFKFSFEYVPPFEVNEYRNLEVDIPRREVHDEDVRSALEKIQQSAALIITAPDDATIDADSIVTISVKATCDGEIFKEASSEDYYLEMGRQRLIPGFEEALVGLKKGESKVFDLTMPEDYSMEKYRGKLVHFEATIKDIQVKKVPSLDDDLAKDMDFDSLEELKKEVESNLNLRLGQDKKKMGLDSLRKVLVDKNPIEVPLCMVDAEFKYLMASQELTFKRLGTSFSAMGEFKDRIAARNLEAAQDRVKEMLIIQKIAEKEEIKVIQSELLEYLEGIAELEGLDIDKFMSHVHKNQMEPYYVRELLEEKVLENLYETTKVNEVEPPAVTQAPESESPEATEQG